MKITLINCYFGKLPNYFPLWLQSSGANPEVDFLFVTDSILDAYDVPENIHIVHNNWEELLKKIEAKFPFKIEITTPYKLTDFKPAYGYIFEEELSDSDYWGYCDIDLVFGDILKFIAPRIEEGYEKIYRLGHLTILKNNPEMIHLFEKEGGAFKYTEVFSNKEFYSFDEHAGLMSIARKQGIKEYYHEDMADISCRIKRMTASRQKNYNYQVFYYENGSVNRAFVDNGNIKKEEYIYIHFQKRQLQIQLTGKSFYILGDMVVDKKAEGIPLLDDINMYSGFVSYRIDRLQVGLFKIKKICKFLFCPFREKIIWLKIKKSEKQYA